MTHALQLCTIDSYSECTQSFHVLLMLQLLAEHVSGVRSAVEHGLSVAVLVGAVHVRAAQAYVTSALT